MHRVSQAPRLVWIDAAKGACISLVVLWHVFGKVYYQLDWGLNTTIVTLWTAVNQIFVPLRMPLFFLISGLLAASAIAKPAKLVMRKRVANHYYVYVVWMAITAILFAIGPAWQVEHFENWYGYFWALVVPAVHPWYLFALAAYFVLAWVFRQHQVAILIAAVVLSVVLSTAESLIPLNVISAGQNFVFFLLGTYRRSWWESLSARASAPLAIVTMAAYAGSAAATMGWDLLWVPGVHLAVGALGICAGILAFSYAAVVAPAGVRPLLWVGARTLPIYLLHMPLLAVVAWITESVRINLDEAAALVVAFFYPVIVTGLLIFISSWIGWILNRGVGVYLFRMPAFSSSDVGIPMKTDAHGL